MVVIDDNEDIIDEPFIKYGGGEFGDLGEDDDIDLIELGGEEYEGKEKSNTTNMVDLIKSVNKQKKGLGTTQVLKDIKKQSFFSQNNQVDDEDEIGEEEEELVFDEREKNGQKH